MRKLADAFYFAPLLNIDGLGHLDMFISSVARWDSRMASKLRMELKAAIPHRYIDAPRKYSYLLRVLSNYTQREWLDLVSESNITAQLALRTLLIGTMLSIHLAQNNP